MNRQNLTFIKIEKTMLKEKSNSNSKGQFMNMFTKKCFIMLAAIQFTTITQAAAAQPAPKKALKPATHGITFQKNDTYTDNAGTWYKQSAVDNALINLQQQLVAERQATATSQQQLAAERQARAASATRRRAEQAQVEKERDAAEQDRDRHVTERNAAERDRDRHLTERNTARQEIVQRDNRWNRATFTAVIAAHVALLSQQPTVQNSAKSLAARLLRVVGNRLNPQGPNN